MFTACAHLPQLSEDQSLDVELSLDSLASSHAGPCEHPGHGGTCAGRTNLLSEDHHGLHEITQFTVVPVPSVILVLRRVSLVLYHCHRDTLQVGAWLAVPLECACISSVPTLVIFTSFPIVFTTDFRISNVPLVCVWCLYHVGY